MNESLVEVLVTTPDPANVPQSVWTGPCRGNLQEALLPSAQPWCTLTLRQGRGLLSSEAPLLSSEWGEVLGVALSVVFSEVAPLGYTEVGERPV